MTEQKNIDQSIPFLYEILRNYRYMGIQIQMDIYCNV